MRRTFNDRGWLGNGDLLGGPPGQPGFTLIEVLVSMAVFGILVSGIYAAYIAQVRHTGREYRIAEAEMELGIGKKIIERDLAMAGYGLADDYSAVSGTTHFNTVDGVNLPRPIRATNGGSDTLTLMGTALGMEAAVAQRWSYMITAPGGATPPYAFWNDAREDLQNGDRVILIEPTSKSLLQKDGKWLFAFDDDDFLNTALAPVVPLDNPAVGTLIYGLAPDNNAVQPYYAVRYYLGDPSDRPRNCAPGSASLLRAESRNDANPMGGDPLVACVLDFQIALGLDTDENGSIDLWDNGGSSADGFDVASLKRRLKQVRLYLLIQTGNREGTYTFPTASVRVGDAALGTGGDGDLSLTTEQRRYRWRVISIIVAPRNIR